MRDSEQVCFLCGKSATPEENCLHAACLQEEAASEAWGDFLATGVEQGDSKK